MSEINSHNRGDNAANAALAQRRAALAILAQAKAIDIVGGMSQAGDGVDFIELRAPEIGLVMLRGRIGGDGALFNAGEATVTRAAVQLASGQTGFGYVLGRDREKARLVALCDALWQIDSKRQSLEERLLTPLRKKQQERHALGQAQTAATRVDFFTLVRGEDDR
jgi:alpha-D-ribose 1-methylphosphonate 5-triphosphate synthase subunit PhnG